MSVTQPVHPSIRELAQAEIEAILRRNHVGRIAFNWKNRIDVEPVHYVFSEGALFLRTSAGEKYHLVADSFYGTWPVAFEVDEVEGFFRWRSVVVHGSAFLVAPPGPDEPSEAWDEALSALRTLLPETLTGDDPVPFRNVILRIVVQEATGRDATLES